jgi:hypothetical protein
VLTRCGCVFTEGRRIRIWRGRPTVEVDFRMTGAASAKLRGIVPNKVMTQELAMLHPSEGAALLNALIDGDGHRRADGRICIIQKDKQSIDWMQILAMRLGYRAILSQRTEGTYVLYLTTGDWLTLRGTNGTHPPIPREHYSGAVWCPSVSTGFWLARRKGKPFITGNTYPRALVEPCVKAGTSEKGCCWECGAPWRRVTQPSEDYAKHFGGNTGADSDRYGAGYRKRSAGVTADYVTTGWKPTCSCNFGPETVVPCTVLDPFGGSGTTAEVALSLGRRAILCELNPKYVDLIKKRLKRVQFPLNLAV